MDSLGWLSVSLPHCLSLSALLRFHPGMNGACGSGTVKILRRQLPPSLPLEVESSEVC